MTIYDFKGVNRNSQLAPPIEEINFSQILVSVATDAAFCLAADARFLFVNEATCRLSEYSRKELLGMKIYEIDVNYSLQSWSAQWEALQQQGYISFKSCYRAKGGRIFLASVNLTYVKHQDREFACAFVRRQIDESDQRNGHGSGVNSTLDLQEELQQEVFEYQSTETQLEASLSLLRSTLESTANGILAVNFEGEILYYNQKFREIWQLPPEVRLSRHCNQATIFLESQVKDPEKFRSSIWETPIESNVESYDLLELKDERIFAHYSEPYKINDKIIGRVWSFWDITESKRTEEALKRNVARFRALAENTDASIFLIQDTNLCYVNRAAAVLTGYTKSELLNKFDLNVLIKNRKHRQLQKQDGSSGCEYQEMQIVTKGGIVRWLACTVEVLNGMLDFASQPVQLITAIDITDYKYVESEMRQALDQAKRLSELRQRFVSMLCHQFRTPLNIVSFSADLLRRNLHQWNDDKSRSYLDLIHDAIVQISELLDEILLFGKAETDKISWEPQPIQINHFCRDIIAQIELAHGNQKLVSFNRECCCTTAELDPKLLQHILTNLLSNAIKYSPTSDSVSFEACCEDNSVVFQVKDAGIGIPIVDQQQIFEPFYRGSNIDSIPGTGLGLSIVKTLVELQGGEISLDSVVGIGTTFTIKLPLGKDFASK